MAWAEPFSFATRAHSGVARASLPPGGAESTICYTKKAIDKAATQAQGSGNFTTSSTIHGNARLISAEYCGQACSCSYRKRGEIRSRYR